MELIFTGKTLANNGLTPGTRIALQHKHPVLYITVVNDNATWETLCEACQHNPTFGTNWLTEIGIIQAEHVDITTAPGIISIR